jgi:hypothetical protein
MVNPTSLIVPVVVAGLIIWRVYARIRRMVGRQRLYPLRSGISAALFCALVLALCSAPMVPAVSKLVLLASVAAGIGLAIYGLHVTKFELTSDGLFYTPNARIGLILALVLVSRIVYRLAFFAVMFSKGPPVGPPQAGTFTSPLTMAALGALAGYFIGYSSGLLIRWVQRNQAAHSVVQK